MQRLIVAVPRHILRFFSLILPILFSRIELFLSFIFSFCFIFKNICHLQLKLASFEKFIFFMTNISHIIDYVNCACILYSQLFFFFFFLTFQCITTPPTSSNFEFTNKVFLLPCPINFFLSRCPQKHYTSYFSTISLYDLTLPRFVL